MNSNFIIKAKDRDTLIINFPFELDIPYFKKTINNDKNKLFKGVSTRDNKQIKAIQVIKNSLSDKSVEYRRTEFVGPKVGEELINAGKIRYVGLSNETPWGTMKFLEIAKQINLPQMMSIQNAYNLVNRVFDIANSEVSIN